MAAARRSFGGEWDVFESNVLSMINIARLALEKRALFVLASSVEVCSAVRDPSMWLSEDDCVCGRVPSSPYAASKVSAEVVARHYALRSLRVSVPRPTNTYGRLIFVKSEETRGHSVEKA